MEGSKFYPLIRTKILVPRASKLVSRPRLLDYIHQSIRKHIHLFLVSAGPGYGKTSLLVDFAHNTDLAVCWYTLDSTDHDPRLFMEYLTEAIRLRFPAVKPLPQGQSLRGMIGALVNELAEKISEDIVIILDEYHTVADEDAVHEVVRLLLEFLPRNVYLIVASRSVPPLDILRLVAYGEMAGIGTDALKFSGEEVRAVLQLLSVQLAEDQVRQLTQETEGWITGVILGSPVWGQIGTFLGRTATSRSYDYLTEEVLAHLDSRTRSFLEQIAILNRIEPRFCDGLLGRQDSAEILEMLEHRNLFLSPLEAGWYRFHGLFRESLLRETRSKDSFVLLNRRAAQLWQERGNHTEAVEHLLAARAYKEAIAEIKNLSYDLFVRGHWQTLLRWASVLPAEFEDPQVLLFEAKACMETGRIDNAVTCLQRAEPLLKEMGDLKGQAQALSDRSICLRLQGTYREALAVAQEALPLAEQVRSTSLADLHRTMGVCYAAQGDLVEAEGHFRAAVENSSCLPLYDQALAHQDLGVCLRAQGQMEEAETASRKALAYWQEIGNPAPIANILNNLAMDPYLRGDIQLARELLEQALTSAERSLSPFSRALVRASLGDTYRIDGDFDTAWRIYQEGLEFAMQAHNASLVSYLLEAAGNIARRQGALTEAHRYLAEAMEAAGSSRSDQNRIRASLALLKVAERDVQAAQALIEEVTTTETERAQVHLQRIHLVQAIVLYHSGNDFQDPFCQAERLAQQTGTVEPLLSEAAMLRPLLERISPSEAGLSEELYRRLLSLPSPRAASSLAEEGPVFLRVLALGPGQVFRGEVEIDWRGNLPRELFFYLYMNAPMGKEQIGLAFWPDETPANMTRRLHTSLHRARAAIGTDFVVFDRGAYRWNKQVVCLYDVDDFERSVNQARALSPSNDSLVRAAIEQAVSLYKSDLLDGLAGDWCLSRREKLRRDYLWCLLRLGEIHLAQGDLSRAEEMFRTALQVEDLNEEPYRGLMRIYASRGDMTRVAKVYANCRHRLSRELALPPSSDTQRLYNALLRQESP